jgi:hypothetical protein
VSEVAASLEPSPEGDPVVPAVEEESVSPRAVAAQHARPIADRAERLAPLVAGAVLALPTLLAHYLPMSDLPLHEGAVGVMRHLGDDTYFAPDLYRLNLGHPNQLFYVAAWLVSYAVGTIWAVKIVIALTQFMIFWTGAKLADHLGRSRWGVVLLAPLALGFTYYWGMVANLVGFAAFLGVLPAMDRAAADPRWRRVATTCGLLLITFFAHESVFMTATGFLAMLALAYPLELRKTTLRLLPVAFATTLAIGHQIWATQFFTGGAVVTPTAFTPLLEKLVYLPNDLFGSHDMAALVLLAGLSALAVILLLVARLRSKEGPPPGSRPHAGEHGARRVFAWMTSFILRYRFELTGLGFLLSFFAMPFGWRGATLLYERFLGPAWALLAICAAPRHAPPRLAKLAGSVLPVAVLLTSWPQFADANNTYRDLDVVIAAVPKNSAVALAVLDRPVFRTRVYSASVGPARTVADRGGRVGLSLLISPISPVQLNPAYRWDEFDRRTLLSGSRALQPSHDLKRFGWVIAQSREIDVRHILVEAFKPDAELVVAQGEWLLFRSTHPQQPLTSPDAPHNPTAETILDRVSYLAHQQHLRRKAEAPSPPAAAP